MSGKYFVDVSKINDVSKLLGMLSGYTKVNWWFPTDYLFVDIPNRVVYKKFDTSLEYVKSFFKQVGYDEIINILEGISKVDDVKTNLIGKKRDVVSEPLSDDDKSKFFDAVKNLKAISSVCVDANSTDYTDSNLLILNDYLKNGTKIQFNISGNQWYNVTGKFKLEQLKHKSMKLRYKPESVEVDGMMMKPDAAIKYINKHYDTEVDGDKN